MGESEQERQVGAGRRLHVEAATVVGEPRGRGAARVDDDEAAGCRAAARWPMNGGMVSATLVPSSRIGGCLVEVLERERQPAVDAERAVARRRRR